jgi:hypothetical protein
MIDASDAAGTVGAYAADMLNNVVAGWSGAPVRALPAERPIFSAVLDCFDTGVVLLGERGEIVHANGAMRALERFGVFTLGPRSLAFTERRAAETFALRLSAREAGEAAFVGHDASGLHAIVFRVIESRLRALARFARNRSHASQAPLRKNAHAATSRITAGLAASSARWGLSVRGSQSLSQLIRHLNRWSAQRPSIQGSALTQAGDDLS